MLVLETHSGSWEDPVVRVAVAVDLLYLVALGLLVGLAWLRWGRPDVAGEAVAVALSATAVLGLVGTVVFVIPLIPVPSGDLFRVVWPGSSHPAVVVVLGAAPGVLGLYVLWRTRRELAGAA